MFHPSIPVSVDTMCDNVLYIFSSASNPRLLLCIFLLTTRTFVSIGFWSALSLFDASATSMFPLLHYFKSVANFSVIDFFFKEHYVFKVGCYIALLD